MQCAFIVTYGSPPGISLTILSRRELVFREKGGILQMAAYWNHCQKEKRLYQAHIESNIQLRISLRLFFHAVMSILIFPACCST